MQPFALLTDNFNDNSIDSAKWGNSFGSNYSEVAQRARIDLPASTAGYSGFSSTDPKTLIGSYVQIQVNNAGDQALSSLEVYPIQLESAIDTTDKLLWLITGNIIMAYHTINGSNTQLKATDAYDPDIHRFFRIREASGTLYWDYSTDGITWTNYFSESTPVGIDITSMYGSFIAGTYSTEATATFVLFDNFNVLQEETVTPLIPVYHRIIATDQNDKKLGEFQTFKELKYARKLNNFAEASFDIPANDAKLARLIALRRNHIYIYRVENNEEILVWGGEQAVRRGKLDQDQNNWATIVCFDWFEQLTGRRTSEDQSYTDTDAGAIAWDLIDTTQNEDDGDFGITQGSIDTTVNRDRQYFNDQVAEMIINLSNVINGFDFEITPEKVFNVYESKGEDKTDSVRYVYGLNVVNAEVVEDFTNAVTRAIVLGQSSEDPDNMKRVTRTDEAARSLYKLREGVLNIMEVTEDQTFNDKGDAVLRKFNKPLISISFELVSGVSPNILDFEIGDILSIVVKYGIYDIDRPFRVFGWEVSIDSQNAEHLNLILGDFTIENE